MHPLRDLTVLDEDSMETKLNVNTLKDDNEFVPKLELEKIKIFLRHIEVLLDILQKHL